MAYWVLIYGHLVSGLVYHYLILGTQFKCAVKKTKHVACYTSVKPGLQRPVTCVSAQRVSSFRPRLVPIIFTKVANCNTLYVHHRPHYFVEKSPLSVFTAAKGGSGLSHTSYLQPITGESVHVMVTEMGLILVRIWRHISQNEPLTSCLLQAS